MQSPKSFLFIVCCIVRRWRPWRIQWWKLFSNFDIVISNEVDRRIFSKQKPIFSFIHSQVVSRPKFEVGMHILKYSSSYAHFNLFSDESEIESPCSSSPVDSGNLLMIQCAVSSMLKYSVSAIKVLMFPNLKHPLIISNLCNLFWLLFQGYNIILEVMTLSYSKNTILPVCDLGKAGSFLLLIGQLGTG